MIMKDKLNRLDAILHELQLDEYLNEDSLPKIGEAKGLVNELVKNCSIPAVVGRSEQLVCDKCGYPMFYHKPDDIMYCHGCENTKPAN